MHQNPKALNAPNIPKFPNPTPLNTTRKNPKTLIHPKYPLLKTIRALLKGHWGGPGKPQTLNFSVRGLRIQFEPQRADALLPSLKLLEHRQDRPKKGLRDLGV